MPSGRRGDIWVPPGVKPPTPTRLSVMLHHVVNDNVLVGWLRVRYLEAVGVAVDIEMFDGDLGLVSHKISAVVTGG